MKDTETAQRAVCKKHGCQFVASGSDSKLAISTLGELPVNGLRHPPQGDTSGWYGAWSDAGSPAIRACYEKRRQRKRPQVARVALARKLLTRVWARLRHGVSFEETVFAEAPPVRSSYVPRALSQMGWRSSE